MATKTKFKLKKKYKITLVMIFLILLLIFTGFKINNIIKYHQTLEYKFLKKGYDIDTYEIINDKLNNENIDYLLKNDRIDYIGEIVGQKYFIEDYFYDYLSFFEENNKKSFNDVVTLINVGADKEWYEKTLITDTTKHPAILVNKFNALPEDYKPSVIKKFSSTYAYGDVSAEETCYNAFINMAKSAKKDGITLILTSGYRTHERQKAIYENMKKTKGQAYADEYAARPGQSEHETGLALDILTYNGNTATFKETETYKWLHTHAHEYGFIERYEENKEYITGYEAESWHYRYVGEEIARHIKELEITFDEYYAFYLRS